MYIEIVGNRVTVTRTSSAEKFRSESALWFCMKLWLRVEKKMDIVKRVMSKDGHMVGGNTHPYYLRDRKHRFCIWDPNYALRDLAKCFNELGVVSLTYEQWEKKQCESTTAST